MSTSGLKCEVEELKSGAECQDRSWCCGFPARPPEQAKVNNNASRTSHAAGLAAPRSSRHETAPFAGTFLTHRFRFLTT